MQTVLGHRKLNLLPQRSGNRFKRLSLLLFSGLLPPVAYSSDQGRAIYLQRARLHQQHLTPPSSTFSQFSQKTTPNKPTSTTRLSARPISQLCQTPTGGAPTLLFLPGEGINKTQASSSRTYRRCFPFLPSTAHTNTHTHTPAKLHHPKLEPAPGGSPLGPASRRPESETKRKQTKTRPLK